jgi:hypothetical protein
MKAKSLVAVTALALATGAVFAQEAGPLTRAEVKQQVLDARAAGTLRHAGETAPEEMTPYQAQVEAPSTLSRAQARTNVLQARASGDLLPAGDFSPSNKAYSRMVAAPSSMTRDQMKAEVLEARAEGTLIPAGEGVLAPRGNMHPTFAKGMSEADENVASGRK